MIPHQTPLHLAVARCSVSAVGLLTVCMLTSLFYQIIALLRRAYQE